MTTDPVVPLKEALSVLREQVADDIKAGADADEALAGYDESRDSLIDQAFVPEPAKPRQRVWIDHHGLIVVSVDQGVEDGHGNRLHTVYWANGKACGRETRPDMGDVPIFDVITLLGIERATTP